MAPILTSGAQLPGFAYPERTNLSPEEEKQFRIWVKLTGLTDVDHPLSKYDYRGYWKGLKFQRSPETKMYPDGLHYTDRYKQHGHPTFSSESQYSSGPFDGGMWAEETYIPQPPVAVSHKRKK